MKARLFLVTLAVVVLAFAACSAPDPGFVGPATRGHSGVVGSTSGSGTSGGSGSKSGAGTSSGGAATDAGGGSGGTASPATYGTACATNADCSGNAYNECQTLAQKRACTKPCTTGADCPSPPTGGTCNAAGYCQ